MPQNNSLFRRFKNQKTFYFNHLILTILISHLINLPISGQSNCDEFKLSPIPSWVKEYPVPVLESNSKLDLVLIHRENQFNHNTKEFFKRNFYYLKTTEGLNQIRSFYDVYKPLYQTLQINKVNIYRKNDIIRLNNQLHVEYKFESKQIGGVVYDNDAQIRIFFNQAKIGDIVEIAYTIVGEQPDLHGTLNFYVAPIVDNLRGKNYFRLVTSGNEPIHFNALNVGVKPIIEHFNGLSTIEFISSNDEILNRPITPSWYSNTNEVYFYNKSSWKEVNDLYVKNFELDDSPSDIICNKVYELTNNLKTIQEKINAVLNFTQKDIFYLDYGLIEPKRPELVIKQGFGDCKSKSLLIVKMLESLDINAWPVIVKNTGLDERLLNTYSGQIFNHCVVEFVNNNDTIPFDPTLEPQNGNIDQKYFPDFRYGLRLIKNNNKLSRLKAYSFQKLDLIATIAIISNPNINSRSKINWQLNFEGNLANRNNFLFNEQGVNAVFRTVSTDLINRPFLDPSSSELSYYQNKDQPSSELRINSLNDLPVFEYGNDLKFLPRPLYEWLKVINPDKLGHCFSLPEFKETSHLFKFKVSNWMDFQPDSARFENDWIQYYKKTWQENDTIYASYTAKILKTDLDSSRYIKVIEDIQFLKKDMELNFGKGRNSFIRKLTFPILQKYRNRKKGKKMKRSSKSEIVKIEYLN